LPNAKKGGKIVAFIGYKKVINYDGQKSKISLDGKMQILNEVVIQVGYGTC
jgi:hypothetical protein